uniref:Sesquipedalian n=1 Tax=Ursus americanus TaxID=9643 RepID=A0A452SKM4_URSAM
MKLNERSLAFYATCDAPVDNAGFLYKKGGRHAAYHRRWFVLRGNMLFYFEDPASREPVGVIILEGCTVELVEAAEEFAFAVRFAGARARTYVLAAESQAAMEGWVKALSRASFDYLRLVVRELEQQLAAMRVGDCPAPPRRPRALPPKENGCAVWSAPALGLAEWRGGVRSLGWTQRHLKNLTWFSTFFPASPVLLTGASGVFEHFPSPSFPSPEWRGRE